MICTDFQKTSKLSQKTYVATIWKIAKKKKHASTWRQRLGFFHKKFMAWKLWCNFPNDLRVYTKGKKISNFGESFFFVTKWQKISEKKNIGRVSFFLKYVKKELFLFCFFFSKILFELATCWKFPLSSLAKKHPLRG